MLQGFLEAGGLILYPTDTIWGIGCDATNEKAIGKIYKLKNRQDKKSMIILVADEKDIFNYVEKPDKKYLNICLQQKNQRLLFMSMQKILHKI